MKRIALTLVVIGLSTVLAGFVYGVIEVNVPFQDPTPKQAWQQARGMAVSQAIAAVGTIQFLLGILFGLAAFVAACFRKKTSVA